MPMLWDSTIELGWDFFNEIIRRPVPLDMNTLTALKRCSLGLDLYLWLAYRTFRAEAPATALLAAGCTASFGVGPGQSQRQASRQILPPPHSARVEENQAGLAGVKLHDGSGYVDPASLYTCDRTAQSRPTTSLVFPFPPQGAPLTASARAETPSRVSEPLKSAPGATCDDSSREVYSQVR